MNFHGYLFRQFFFTTLLVLYSLLGVVWLNHALRMLELVVNKGTKFDRLSDVVFVPLALMADDCAAHGRFYWCDLDNLQISV